MEREVQAALEELNSGWVEFESKGANFGDARLNKRFSQVLGQMSQMPQSPFNQSSECLAEMLGAYRFIDNPKVTIRKLLKSHLEQVSCRAEGEEMVYLIQDTSFLDYSAHHKCGDLQPLKIRKMKKSLWLHATFCLLPNGLPLGVVDAQFLTGNNRGQGSDGRIPIEEKLSYRWLDAVNNCAPLFSSGVKKVWICDQEGDIYELFDHIHSRNEEYIIRSRFSREVEEHSFFDIEDIIAKAPICGHYELPLASNGERDKRTAKLEIKYACATITAPQHREEFVTLDCIPSYVIEAKEIDTPAGLEPIHWRVITSLQVESLCDALGILTAYQKRWAIEELFKILKSGCRAEKAQFHNTDRLSKYITLSLIVAWRIYFLVHVNRIEPDAPVEVVLTTSERDT